VKIGATVVGAGVGGVVDGASGVETGIAILKTILGALSEIQKLLVGNWEPSAVKLIDALGNRLSKEVG
jgi:hypothetical protein